LRNLLRTPHARALIPLAVRQVLFIKKSGACNPMIVDRLRVIDLRGKKGQGKQQTRSHRFPPFGYVRPLRT
jgi:hypothetical protein